MGGASCPRQVGSPPCFCAIDLCTRPRPLLGLRRSRFLKSPASSLVSPFHRSLAPNVNFRLASRGNPLLKTIPVSREKSDLLEFAFGPEPIVNLIAWEVATLKIDFICAAPDFFVTWRVYEPPKSHFSGLSMSYPSPFLSQLNCSRSQLALRTAAAATDSIHRRCLDPISPSGPAKLRNTTTTITATNKIVTITTSIRLRSNHVLRASANCHSRQL